MEITWYGHSCFRITERGRASVVTDPFGENLGYEVPRLKADVVTISHDAPGHNHIDAVRGAEHIITGPGEYEIGGVFIIGVPTYNKESEHTRLNVIYVLDFEGLSVAHLGDLDHVPNQSMIESLGSIDVALVPVGGGSALGSSQAAEVVSLLEPSIVVPMHFQTEALRGLELDPVDRFLKEMGVNTIAAEPMLKVTPSSLPEQTQVILLDYQQ